jgi:hypothetical protein
VTPRNRPKAINPSTIHPMVACDHTAQKPSFHIFRGAIGISFLATPKESSSSISLDRTKDVQKEALPDRLELSTSR